MENETSQIKADDLAEEHKAESISIREQASLAQKDEPPLHIVDPGSLGKIGSTVAGQGSAKPICFDEPSLEPSSEDPLGIKLHTHSPRAAQSQDMRNLVRDIFAVEHVVRVLFGEPKYKAARKQFFDGLLTTAKVGLSGPDYDVETGRLNLSLTQDEIADAFPVLRDALWRSYFVILVSFTLIFGLLGCILYYHLFVKHVFADHNKDLLDAVPAFPQICLALLWIPFGVPIGIFLEFIFRVGEKISYDALIAMNPGRWKPWRRTVGTLITGYVLAFILGVGAFQIGISNILLNDFISTRPWLSVAIGFVTGFTFPYVRDIVTQFKPERRDTAARGNEATSGRDGTK